MNIQLWYSETKLYNSWRFQVMVFNCKNYVGVRSTTTYVFCEYLNYIQLISNGFWNNFWDTLWQNSWPRRGRQINWKLIKAQNPWRNRSIWPVVSMDTYQQLSNTFKGIMNICHRSFLHLALTTPFNITHLSKTRKLAKWALEINTK